jgi:hypothetical protein
MAQPSLLALGFIGGLGSLISQWPTGPPNINATPPPSSRAGVSRSGLWGPELLHSLSGIRLPVSSEPTRTSCPGSGGRTVLRHPCLQTRGGESPLRRAMHWNGYWRVQISNFEVRTSHFSAATHPRRSCSAFAGWDSLIARSDHPRLRYSDELSTA